MDCTGFKENLNDYLENALYGEAMDEARAHMKECSACSGLAAELQSTRALLCRLERKTAPIGFEERLRARIVDDVPVPTRGVAAGWLQNVFHRKTAKGGTSRRVSLRPALATLLFCGVLIGSLFHGVPVDKNSGPGTDWAYIENCRVQHEAFVETSPLNDESALLLKEQANRPDSDLQSAEID